MKKLDQNMVFVLKTLSKGQLTTKELENEVLKDYEVSRATFYNTFKKAKDNELVNSSTNQKHEIVWNLSKKGAKFLEEQYRFIGQEFGQTLMSSLEELYKRLLDHKGEWMDAKELRKLFKVEEDRGLVKSFTFLMNLDPKNMDKFLEFDRIKINKEKLREVIDKTKFV